MRVLAARGAQVQQGFFAPGCDCYNDINSTDCGNDGTSETCSAYASGFPEGCESCFDLGDNFAEAMDVQSFSYNYESYEIFHNKNPWKPVGGGEAALCCTDRGDFGPMNQTQGHVGPYIKKPWNKDSPGDLFECIERSWIDVANTEFVYGNFAWTGYDYKGETTLGWPDINSHYGIHDIAGFPKVGAGYYRAWWRTVAEGCQEVGLSPDDWTQPGGVANGATIEVRVTTCASFAALFVNGVSQDEGTGPMTMPRFGSLK